MPDSTRARLQYYVELYLRGERFTGDELSEIQGLTTDPEMRESFSKQIRGELQRRESERQRLRNLWLRTPEADEYRAELDRRVEDPNEKAFFLHYIAGLGADHVEAGERIPEEVEFGVRSLLAGPKADLNTLLTFGEIVGRLEKEREQP